MKRLIAILSIIGVMMSIPAMAAGINEQPTMVYEPKNEEAPIMTTSFEVAPEMLDASHDGTYTYVPENPEAPIVTVYEGDLPALMSGDVIHINNVHHSGSDDFTDTFSCKASDGNRLNIFVQNNGNNSVIVNITWKKFLSKEEYPAVTVNSGKNMVQTYSYDNNKGIDGNWTVNVTTASGGSMDINVAARQYQIN